MRVFITGATGFIGRALVTRLHQEGHEVIAWVRDRRKALEALGSEVPLLEVTEPDAALSESLATCDALVNLAGAPIVGRRWTRRYRKELVESRVALTRRVMKAISPGKVQTIISGSAVGYYGDRREEALVETSTPGDDFLATLCCDWEQAARDGAPTNCRLVSLRTGVVLGRGGGALSQMLGPFRVGMGGPVGSGRQVMSWIHLDDLVEVVTTALEDPRYTGPINGTAPNPITNRDFSKALGKALGRPAFVPVPNLALKALFGEASEVMVASQRAMPAALETLGFTFHYPELADALADILS